MQDVVTLFARRATVGSWAEYVPLANTSLRGMARWGRSIDVYPAALCYVVSEKEGHAAMSRTVAPSNRGAITLAFGLYLVWVLATYLLEMMPAGESWRFRTSFHTNVWRNSLENRDGFRTESLTAGERMTRIGHQVGQSVSGRMPLSEVG
jgi:hypothetical protein